MIVSQLISAVLQVIVFSVIPFVLWLITRKKSGESFFSYIGMYLPPGRAILYSILIAILFVVSGTGFIWYFNDLKSLLNENTVQGQLHAMGLNSSSLLILLIGIYV